MLFETVGFVKLCLKYMRMLVNNWMQHIYIQLGFRSVHLKSKHVLSLFATLYTQVARIPAWFSSERAAVSHEGKRRVVILGTGWAAHAIAKIIDINKVDIRVISPRNYFVSRLQ